jgi:hypothetical protein
VTVEAAGIGAAFVAGFDADVPAGFGAGAVNFALIAAWIVGMSIWLASWPSTVS